VETEVALLNLGVSEEEHLLVLVDLGYEKFRAFPAVVVSHKAPKGGKLSEAQKEWNRLIGAKQALVEKANAGPPPRPRSACRMSCPERLTHPHEHAMCMVFIQVRNVEEELREAAKQRAAELGVDLSTYVRNLIRRDVTRPSMASWLEDVTSDPIGKPFNTAEAITEARAERDEQIRRNLGDAE
jgi:antitoxin component of RelBE/YafQ-DinJ toxin-antitoxin module